MVAAVRQTVPITEDGRIEVRAPELRAGATAEVIVLLPATDDASDHLATMEWLAKLDEYQRAAALTPEAAAKWIEDIRAERQAYHPVDEVGGPT